MTRPEDPGAHRGAGVVRSRAPRRGAVLAIAALAALALLAPAASSAAPRPPAVDQQKALTQPRTTVGFWAGEAVPGTDWDLPDTYWNPRSTRVFTPRLWRILHRNHVPIYFNLRYRRDFGPVPPGQPQRNDALPIIRTANRLGVPVWGWILIPYSEGYWAWEGAAAEHFRAVRALVAWTREKHVRLEGMALDPEPPLRTPFESSATIMGGGGAAFSSIFQPVLDPARQCEGWRGYARIVRWAERRHVKVSAAPMPAALDDLADGRLALQDAAQFVLPPAPWHQLFFQAYRSVFAYYSGHDPGPGIVSSYFRSAQREFGGAGQISLGSAGRRGYRRLATLIHDVRLAATLGAREVPIYSLERTVNAYGGPRAVARLAQAAHHPYAGPFAIESTAPTADAKALRGAVRRADRAAVAATVHDGNPLRPNAWPDACG